MLAHTRGQRCSWRAASTLLLVLLLTGWPARADGLFAAQGSSLLPSLAATLNSYANGLLLAATTLYLMHLWWAGRGLGRWASVLALLGALGLLASVGLGVAGGQHNTLAGLDEVMALFSAFTVLIYLNMERFYRSRSAGAFVMSIVAASVLFQIWLTATTSASNIKPLPWLGNYWVQAHIFTNFLGYAAFALGAALASMLLLHATLTGLAGLRLRVLPEVSRLEQWMRQAVYFGFPMFSLGILAGMRAAFLARGAYWTWNPKESWALAVWGAYAGFFILQYVSRWQGRRLAWWVLASFVLTAIGLLLPQLCTLDPHPYG